MTIKACRVFIIDENLQEPHFSTIELPLQEKTALLHKLTSSCSYSKEQVYVLTPGGDVEILSAGSTPIDFAYKVHTDIGNHCSEAKVNGKKVPLNTELNNGDTVEIITRKNSSPKSEWLRTPKNPQDHPFVFSNSTRTKIRKWFREKSYEESISNGKYDFQKTITKTEIWSNLNFDKLLKSEFMKTVVKKLNFPNVDGLLAAIGYGGTNQITLEKVINELNKVAFELGRDLLIKELGQPNVDILEETNFYVEVSAQVKSFKDFAITLAHEKSLLDLQVVKKLKDRAFSIDLVNEKKINRNFKYPEHELEHELIDKKYIRWIIGNEEGLRYRFALCCQVDPFGDNIGVSKGAGFVIHNQKCGNLRNASKNRLEKVTNAVNLKIKTSDRVGMERDIADLFYEHNLNIREGSVKTSKDKKAVFIKSITIDNTGDIIALKKVQTKLKNMIDVHEHSYIEKKETYVNDGRATYIEEK